LDFKDPTILTMINKNLLKKLNKT